MATMSNSPITQVPTHTNLQPQLLTRLLLDLRGRRFEVDREKIMNLPELVLLCPFPNGLVLSRQRRCQMPVVVVRTRKKKCMA